MKALIFISIYIFLASLTTLFFRACGYNENKDVCKYLNNAKPFYEFFFNSIQKSGYRLSSFVNSSGTLGCLYRHLLIKEFLFNKSKLNGLKLTNEDMNYIEEYIIDGYKEKTEILSHLNFTICWGVVLLGIFVGNNIRL